MQGLAHIMGNLSEYTQLLQAAKNRVLPAAVTGVSAVHRAMLAYALALDSGQQIMLVVNDEPTALRMCDDLNMLLGDSSAVYFPAREYVFRNVEGASREFEHQRLAALQQLCDGQVKILVASIEAATQYTMPKKLLESSVMKIESDKSYDLNELMKFLAASGYQRRDQVDGKCQFAVRGGILDVFPPHMSDPVRIEFWDEDIDTMSTFKTDTQRRFEPIDSFKITPAREVLFDDKKQLAKLLEEKADTLKGKATLKAKEQLLRDAKDLQEGVEPASLDRFLPLIYPELPTAVDFLNDGIVCMCDSAAVKESNRAFMSQHSADIEILLEEGLIFKGCSEFYAPIDEWLAKVLKQRLIIMDSFARTVFDIPVKTLVDFTAVQISPWSGEMLVMLEELEDRIRQKYCCVIFAGTERSAKALCTDLNKEGYSCDFLEDVPKLIEGKVYVLQGSLSSGMEFPAIKLAVMTYRSSNTKLKPKAKKKNKGLRSIADLEPGDYVVHVSHGIGVFEGIIKREIHGVTKDYIKIRYAGTDALFVPVTQLDLVSKYIGGRDEITVKLNRLNSAEWSKTRQRVRKAVKDMADELVKLYAARMACKGYSFSPDNDWQNDFELRFPYNETDDQLRCIQEIKSDMESETPMDRLLCGDVGFGKTEVAVRAAFKCVMDSKQCAVLVPTTILAWQHFQTFKQRMAGFPIKVDLLSRFRTPREQEQVLKELRRGETDIIIGTHRMVQKDVAFKDLGLVIIDEEQRFGVAHKEKFKELCNNVDVLTLSATPIPRTLNMAMSGIRDMSVIEEAPQDRIPVQTYVMEHDWGVIRQAILKELRRGGQVFYLHNKVDTIDHTVNIIQSMLPDARIVAAHGKMGEEQLSKIWKQLVDNEIDILVCTTIIETGVDVSNCNTLIVEDADRLGLSQLYQIRGRVGRSSRRAYAYMTVSKGKALTDVAAKRLNAIKEFTTFGSGLNIAMRDLEIRGAGSILGAKQHGHMEAVGYEMYLKMLSDAVAVSRGEAPEETVEECLIDIRIEAHIPERYIPNLSQRIDIYKKIAAIQNSEDASDVIDELIDRFGEPPKSVEGLVTVSLMRNTASHLGIKEISQRDDLLLFIPEKFDLQKASVMASSEKLKGRIMLNAGKTPYLAVKLKNGERAVEVMEMALKAMEEAAKQGKTAN